MPRKRKSKAPYQVTYTVRDRFGKTCKNKVCFDNYAKASKFAIRVMVEESKTNNKGSHLVSWGTNR